MICSCNASYIDSIQLLAIFGGIFWLFIYLDHAHDYLKDFLRPNHDVNSRNEKVKAVFR